MLHVLLEIQPILTTFTYKSTTNECDVYDEIMNSTCWTLNSASTNDVDASEINEVNDVDRHKFNEIN